MKMYIQIVDDWADKAVETMDVSTKTQRQIEKIVAGIEINLNHKDYTVYVRNQDNLFEEDN